MKTSDRLSCASPDVAGGEATDTPPHAGRLPGSSSATVLHPRRANSAVEAAETTGPRGVRPSPGARGVGRSEREAQTPALRTRAPEPPLHPPGPPTSQPAYHRGPVSRKDREIFKAKGGRADRDVSRALRARTSGCILPPEGRGRRRRPPPCSLASASQ